MLCIFQHATSLFTYQFDEVDVLSTFINYNCVADCREKIWDIFYLVLWIRLANGLLYFTMNSVNYVLHVRVWASFIARPGKLFSTNDAWEKENFDARVRRSSNCKDRPEWTVWRWYILLWLGCSSLNELCHFIFLTRL